MDKDATETTKSAAGAPVVVGVDGSEHSLAAADYAGDEAARRGVPLEIVHAFYPPLVATPGGVPPDPAPVSAAPGYTEPALREHAEELLHQAAERVRARHPELAMISRRHDGAPAQVLTDASHHAALVAVGHRGMGGFAELLLGSVGVYLANHATCPVVIVRGQPAADAPVVVGIDGSQGAQRAAGFAAETAGRYGVSLVALYAWTDDPGWPPGDVQAGAPPPQVPEPVTRTMEALAADHPSLPVTSQMRRGQPAHEALVAASRSARLLVVGARGVGGFRGLLLGSVSQALIHHAESPVAVVGPAVDQPTGSGADHPAGPSADHPEDSAR